MKQSIGRGRGRIARWDKEDDYERNTRIMAPRAWYTLEGEGMLCFQLIGAKRGTVHVVRSKTLNPPLFPLLAKKRRAGLGAVGCDG